MSERDENNKRAEDPLDKRPAPQSSRLGSSAKLKGDWVCDEDVLIHGQLQGKIDSGNHDIHIEKEAIVKADIQGKNIMIFGKITGNITASGKINVGKEATITGDLSAPRIVIQDGAKFKGTIKMIPKTS